MSEYVSHIGFHLEWPKEVRILSKCGEGKYYYRGGRPCCALGNARYDCNIQSDGFLPLDWTRAYRKCAHVVLKRRGRRQLDRLAGDFLHRINDKWLLDDKERALVYNAAWAYVGYTEGQSEQVLEIAEAATKLNDPTVDLL